MEPIWYEKLSMHSFVSIKKNVYFSALNFNGLFKYNKVDDMVEMLKKIPEENFFSKHLYSATLLIGNQIYLAPMNAKDIAVYDVENNIISKIPLKQKYSTIKSKFFRMLSDDYFIYLIPFRYPAVVKINLKNQKITYLDACMGKSDIFAKNGCFLKKGMLHIALFGENKVLKMNTKTEEYQLLEIPTKQQQGFVDMIFDEEYYWLIQRNYTSVVKYHLKSGRIEYIHVDEFEECQEKVPYIRILDFGEKIFLAAYHGKRSVIIDKKTHQVQDIVELNKFQKPIFKNNWEARFYFAEKIGTEQVLLGNIADHQCIILNIRTNLIEKKYFLENLKFRQTYKEYLLAKHICKETEKFDLIDFCEYVVSYEELLWNKPQKSSYGEQIHKVISNLTN